MANPLITAALFSEWVKINCFRYKWLCLQFTCKCGWSQSAHWPRTRIIIMPFPVQAIQLKHSQWPRTKDRYHCKSYNVSILWGRKWQKDVFNIQINEYLLRGCYSLAICGQLNESSNSHCSKERKEARKHKNRLKKASHKMDDKWDYLKLYFARQRTRNRAAAKPTYKVYVSRWGLEKVLL